MAPHRGAIPGTGPEGAAGSHDGGMAGLEDTGQPRGAGRATAARWSPAVEDEHALKAIAQFGDPTEG
ncbi:ATP-binding protein, partial [Streptomyces sp. TRM76130]|nr:ATP-binding protein [Streptomyces sp. TRM76130]